MTEPENKFENENVAPQMGCPNCHETRVDFLVWLDDDTVECTKCGTTYKP